MSTETPDLQCPLCGARFQHAEQACRTCPLAPGCDVLQCPYCHYAFPRRSRTLEWLRSWWSGRLESQPAEGCPAAEPASGSLPLDRAPVGQPCEVVRITATRPERLLRLAGLGVVPGAAVRLNQLRPAAVVEIGETTVALDPLIVREIEVRRLP